MKTKKVKALQNMTMFVETPQEDINLKPMSGRILINTIERCSLFVHNKKHGPRSTEIMRTPHGRMVRRPDGNYTLTFRFSPDEFCITEQLLLEMRSIATNPLLNLKKRVA